MMFGSRCLSLSLCAVGALGVTHAITLTVSTTGGNASSPLLYGMMFEDINRSGDGGIHGQLLQNNGFQGSKPNNSAYAAVGGAQISHDTGVALSDAIKSSLKVSVPSGVSGKIGFLNYGYNGVPVNDDTYSTSFFVKGGYSGDISVSLNGADGTVYSSADVAVDSTGDKWSNYSTSIKAKASSNGLNTWQLTFDPAKVSGGSLWFDLVTLYPTTYHNRQNGLRPDIANFMSDMSPSFLRFPGGNNLEGNSLAARWIWNQTVGPLENRPGRDGTWQYPNTDALGLLEYMYWCVDMKVAPVLGVFGGAALNGETSTSNALKPYIDEVMAELEFLLGDASTTNGALRAKYGQQDPFSLTMVEIGNEDNLQDALCSSYASRFTDIYNAIHEKYPSLRIIASTVDTKCLPTSLPKGVWADRHHYETPDVMVSFFNEWDNTPRDNDYGIFVGELAVNKAPDGGELPRPNVQGSVAEAVYWIGMERNSDVVKMGAYAPLLEHDTLQSWTPNLITFDSSPNSLTGSTSYYVQKLFASNHGATTLPIKSDSNFGPLYWVASATGGSAPTYYVKLANYGADPQNVTVGFGAAASGTATLQSISGAATDDNARGNTKVKIESAQVQGSGDGYTFTMPGWAAGVLVVGPGSSGGSGSSGTPTSTPTASAAASSTPTSTPATGSSGSTGSAGSNGRGRSRNGRYRGTGRFSNSRRPDS